MSGAEAPETARWFAVNVGDADWVTSETFGSTCRFETPQQAFTQLGINVRVLEPGQRSALYHGESNEESFLVLHGEALLIVDDEERPLRAWDFVHFAPMTPHVLIGAGTGPCVVLMTGARDPGRTIDYPRSERALAHDAGVEQPTSDPVQAYAGHERPAPGRPPRFSELPFAR